MYRTTLAVLAMLNAAVISAHAQSAVLRVTHDARNSELLFSVGPIDLPAAGEHAGHHDHIEQPKAQSVTLPVDAYLHGFTTEIVDGEGRKLPDVLLHHMNIIAPQRRELFSQIMQRVGAAGAETGSVALPRLLGYPVATGDSLIFTVMFHNPTDTSYSQAELRVRMKYSSTGSVLPKLAIQPFYVDVMPPAGIHAYSLPPGRSSRSWEGSPAIPGRIIALGGHMHKYGVALRFENVTTGKILWEAKPAVDDSGSVIGMPRKSFLWRLGVQMNPAHTYRLTAEYDNPTGETIENGAMGTLGGIFVPDERALWPSIDRSHPEYIADVHVTYGRTGGSHH
ncbi:MAG: hypothetical protein ACT4O1_15110 [Gemmatimonadota bacterium]